MQYYRTAICLRKILEQLLEKQSKLDEGILPTCTFQLRGYPEGIKRGDFYPKDARDQQAAQGWDVKAQPESRNLDGKIEQ